MSGCGWLRQTPGNMPPNLDVRVHGGTSECGNAQSGTVLIREGRRNCVREAGEASLTCTCDDGFDGELCDQCLAQRYGPNCEFAVSANVCGKLALVLLGCAWVWRAREGHRDANTSARRARGCVCGRLWWNRVPIVQCPDWYEPPSAAGDVHVRPMSRAGLTHCRACGLCDARVPQRRPRRLLWERVWRRVHVPRPLGWR